jgi:hypothetical protein
MNRRRGFGATDRWGELLGSRWLTFAVALDELDKLGRKLRKVCQSFVDHYRLGSRAPGSGTPRRAFGWDPLALHQEDGLIVFAGQDSVVAFDEHDVWNIRAQVPRCKINIALLETTDQTLKNLIITLDLTQKLPTDGGRSVSSRWSAVSASLCVLGELCVSPSFPNLRSKT